MNHHSARDPHGLWRTASGALGALSALALTACQPIATDPSTATTGRGPAIQADPFDRDPGFSPYGGGPDDPTRAILAPPDPKWDRADDAIIAPIWVGDDTKGSLYSPLWRGAFPGLEDYVYTPESGDCRGIKGTVRVDWDSGANTVHLLVKARGLPVHPVVHRTEGVTWFPNTFHNDPKDIDVGDYRLWMIQASVTTKKNFYYDPNTLLLLGSDYDFPNGGPPGAIAQPFSVFAITGSHGFSADANGMLSHQYTLPYNSITTEGGTFSRAYATFVPQNLCEAAPLQPEISQLRPYVSPWQPVAQAPTWLGMLQAGLGFDIQIDDNSVTYPGLGGNLPYVYSGISVAGNVAALRGGVPRGSEMSIVQAIRNVGPPIIPVQGGDDLGCVPYLAEPHVTAPMYCQMAQ